MIKIGDNVQYETVLDTMIAEVFAVFEDKGKAIIHKRKIKETGKAPTHNPQGANSRMIDISKLKKIN